MYDEIELDIESLFEQVKNIYLDDVKHRCHIFGRLENMHIPLMPYSEIIEALNEYDNPNIENCRLNAQKKELMKFVAEHAMFPEIYDETPFDEDRHDKEYDLSF